jgi:hypothetical protein
LLIALLLDWLFLNTLARLLLFCLGVISLVYAVGLEATCGAPLLLIVLTLDKHSLF